MFRKKQSDTSKKSDSTPVDRMASLIVRVIKQMHELFVQLMTTVVEKIGVRQSKLVFTVALTTTGLYSLYLTGAALLQPKKGIQLFRPAAIQQPKNINQKESENDKALIEVDTATARKLRQFLLHFDSIHQSQPTQYDSILQSRPGLIDSIRMLHQIYYSQQKNEAYEK